MPNNSTTITLQPTNLNHATALFPIFSNAENIQFTNFKTFEDPESFTLFLERFLAIEKGSPLQYGPFSIYQNETIIGLCGLQQIDLAKGKSELWYLLHQNYWGMGLAKKAVQILLAKGQQNSQLQTIYAEAVSSNAASWRILETLGFIKAGAKADGFTKGAIRADISYYSLNMQG